MEDFVGEVRMAGVGGPGHGNLLEADQQTLERLIRKVDYHYIGHRRRVINRCCIREIGWEGSKEERSRYELGL